MYKKEFSVAPNEFFTEFMRSEIQFEEYSSDKKTFSNKLRASPYEHEYHISYPCREKFIQEQPIREADYPDVITDQLVETFEDTRVTFSSFMTNPTYMKVVMRVFVTVGSAVTLQFLLETYGGLKIWVNGNEQVSFLSYLRNTPIKQEVDLTFGEGENEIIVLLDDLGERDVNFGFSMKNTSEQMINGFCLLPFPSDEAQKAKQLLNSIYFAKDYYTEGEIAFYAKAQRDSQLRVRFNPLVNRPKTKMQDGNITEFTNQDRYIEIQATNEQYSIGNVSDYQFASTTKVEFGVRLSDGQYLTRIIPIAIYHQEKYENTITSNTLDGRKKEALTYYAGLSLDDINVGLCRLLLDEISPADELFDQPGFTSGLSLIEHKGDCADFVFVPLLMFYQRFPEKVPDLLAQKIKELSLNFRYWIDEPGNDVMWYFSENHALLFHIAQYLAGNLFPNDIFVVSDRTGEEQAELGKKRIEQWFEHFLRYGLAEWNSVTYIPIDFIGFFALYIGAPDEEIKALAKQALDSTFELVSINSFQQIYASTYGRVYEHNLKSIAMNEIGALTKIAYGIGHFSDALRAAALFSLSDYVPPANLQENFAPQNHLIARYRQGINEAETYLYKTPQYSMVSCQDYHFQKQGYQQHMMNITLDTCQSAIWINHPGEYKYSGENRPSYWAGNGSLPRIYQEKNRMVMRYSIPEEEIPFIHLYYPYWEFTFSIQKDHWLYFGNQTSACLIYFSEVPKLTKEGANAYREYIVSGTDHFVFVKCMARKPNDPIDIDQQLKELKITKENGFQVQDAEVAFSLINEKLLIKQ